MKEEIECDVLGVRGEVNVDPKIVNTCQLSAIKGMEKQCHDQKDDDVTVTSIEYSSNSFEVSVIDSSVIDSSSEDELENSVSSQSNDEMQYNLLDSNSCMIQKLLDAAPSLNSKYFGQPSGDSFRVRGQNYVKDKKKIKAGNNLFELITVDFVHVEQPIYSGICAHPDERVQKWLKSGSKEMPPFVFAVNIFVPPNHHWISYYAVPSLDLLTDTSTPFGALAKPFFFGDCDKYRDDTFKLIPRIEEGNVIVKTAIGSKPTLIGRKLKLHYIREERFMEVIIDIGSDPIASRIVKLARKHAKSLVVDMAFLLEGKCRSTLPENIMGTQRLTHIKFSDNLRTVNQPE